MDNRHKEVDYNILIKELTLLSEYLSKNQPIINNFYFQNSFYYLGTSALTARKIQLSCKDFLHKNSHDSSISELINLMKVLNDRYKLLSILPDIKKYKTEKIMLERIIHYAMLVISMPELIWKSQNMK